MSTPVGLNPANVQFDVSTSVSAPKKAEQKAVVDGQSVTVAEQKTTSTPGTPEKPVLTAPKSGSNSAIVGSDWPPSIDIAALIAGLLQLAADVNKSALLLAKTQVDANKADADAQRAAADSGYQSRIAGAASTIAMGGMSIVGASYSLAKAGGAIKAANAEAGSAQFGTQPAAKLTTPTTTKTTGVQMETEMVTLKTQTTGTNSTTNTTSKTSTNETTKESTSTTKKDGTDPNTGKPVNEKGLTADTRAAVHAASLNASMTKLQSISALLTQIGTIGQGVGTYISGSMEKDAGYKQAESTQIKSAQQTAEAAIQSVYSLISDIRSNVSTFSNYIAGSGRA